MHLGHALGFCLLGLGMIFMPALAPDFFPPDAATGWSLSALWLKFMGWINGCLGCGLTLRYHVLPWVLQVLAWRPTVPAELHPAELLRPAMEIYEELEAGEQEGGQSAA
jgi:hypothetical protein